jgi:hypothetical protein
MGPRLKKKKKTRKTKGLYRSKKCHFHPKILHLLSFDPLSLNILHLRAFNFDSKFYFV